MAIHLLISPPIQFSLIQIPHNSKQSSKSCNSTQMAKPTRSSLPSLLLLIISLSLSVNGDLNVADFGARGDGKTNASQPFLRAWSAACDSHVPTTIYVPRKRYMLGGLVFQGPCNNTGISLRLDGTLVAPDYRNMGSSSDNWLVFSGVEGLSIAGGYLDGRGSSLWACKSTGGKCPDGATVHLFSFL